MAEIAVFYVAVFAVFYFTANRGLTLLKKLIYIILIALVLAAISSCALLQKPLDKRTGFSNYLKETENHIRSEDWVQAKTSLGEANNTWLKLKPLMQVDIDHDYVNSIEENFVRLKGYIDTEDVEDALVTILLIQSDWENIGSL
ncbi:MAG: DUF4363 family protein [Pelotomaculum sp.]